MNREDRLEKVKELKMLKEDLKIKSKKYLNSCDYVEECLCCMFCAHFTELRDGSITLCYHPDTPDSNVFVKPWGVCNKFTWLDSYVNTISDEF